MKRGGGGTFLGWGLGGGRGGSNHPYFEVRGRLWGLGSNCPYFEVRGRLWGLGGVQSPLF